MLCLNTLETNNSSPLASATGLEPHHLTMSMLGFHGFQLVRERYLY